MKTRDMQNLLNRAAAALETPADLSEAEKRELIEDLTASPETRRLKIRYVDVTTYECEVETDLPDSDLIKGMWMEVLDPDKTHEVIDGPRARTLEGFEVLS